MERIPNGNQIPKPSDCEVARFLGKAQARFRSDDWPSSWHGPLRVFRFRSIFALPTLNSPTSMAVKNDARCSPRDECETGLVLEKKTICMAICVGIGKD